MNVVIFKLNHLGDNVVFLPVVQTLRARFPDWRLTVVTSPGEAPLYENSADQVWTSPKPRFDKCWRRPWELLAWRRRVRAARPDACLVSFDQANVSHWLARGSGARVRVGGNLQHIRFANTLTHEVPMPAEAADSVVGWHWTMARELARTAGAEADWPVEIPPPDLRHLVGPVEKRGARPRVVVHGGSSRELNRWPTVRFTEVANGLSCDAEVIWVDRPETAGAALVPAVRRVAAADLRGLATLLAGADLFLGNNSGPMHVAVALGRPGVVITGPSATGWNPFWHRERWRVLRHPALACAPCERPNKETPTCANTAAPLACLDYWSAATVEAECRGWLARWA